MVFLASSYKELPPAGALLLYISADGSFPDRPRPEDTGYDMGGVLMSPKRDVEPVSKNSAQYKEHSCLYPGDLFPFTRRPTFLIIDSDNSLAFSSIPHYFDMPLVVLMSAQDTPPGLQEHPTHKGSLFTLFLHSPLAAFCYVNNIVDIPLHLWDKCLTYVDRFMSEASRLISRCRGIGLICFLSSIVLNFSPLRSILYQFSWWWLLASNVVSLHILWLFSPDSQIFQGMKTLYLLIFIF